LNREKKRKKREKTKELKTTARSTD